jgi:hypothetical protein
MAQFYFAPNRAKWLSIQMRLTATLGRLLLELPGARPGSMGFFTDSSGDPCLEASFEPSGITIEGQASPEQWTAWDIAFRTAVEKAKLPRFPA